ncbi:hypothetical protein O181_006448 [Austropuccinia psidii MF-1]|uniref:DUF7719 domain-containing protein n=1 Tax=Austropuccinia psidii MF-1 TaxID=1389203 RepID=A0A9Q3GGL3_9BASI|nr:hypothetical protein [Austropuccinia psidii MF-1]
MSRNRKKNDDHSQLTAMDDTSATATTSSVGKLQKISSLPEATSDDEYAQDMKLTEAEQLRVIEESGILDRIPLIKPSQLRQATQKPLLEFSAEELNPSQTKVVESQEKGGDGLPPWVDEMFDTILWTIPFNTVFVCLDVAIHAQYGQPVTFKTEIDRLKNIVPCSLILIYYTLHHSNTIFSHLLLFCLSTFCSLWIYSVIRMRLSHAILSLALIGLWCWIMRLSLMV